ncbi:sucrase ferredoxin [Catenulispora subtropica]|uniref:Sucraseferredoxin family protein n=1 Tax=Catenulispora subtropica TaxID=450798 RepID=A0ABN2S3V4_9ACTN
MSVCDSALGGCAAVCRTAREPMADTAPPRAKAWLAVEHPGPWPAFGLPADLPPAAAEVLTVAPAYDVRPQLIRRPDRAGRAGGGDWTIYAAGGPPGARWLERRLTDDVADVAELDLAALSSGPAPGFGERVRDRLLLVCTHGKRDVCCARYGAPVARDLAARGLPVWETTHLGGDQFAANLVCLPDGTYHGLLDRASAAGVAFACLRGEVTPTHYRGRAGVGPA